MKCKFCNGTGWLSVEPESSLVYPCTDCNDERDDDDTEQEADE